MVLPKQAKTMIRDSSTEPLATRWSVRLFGGAAILMGIWFIISHFVSWLVFEQPMSLSLRCFQLAGALLHVICGIGLITRRHWARYLFIGLMLWHVPTLYKTTIAYAFRMMRG